ncbi:MAG: hypothetical protein V3S81_04700 [Anaerolineales bacterium]
MPWNAPLEHWQPASLQEDSVVEVETSESCSLTGLAWQSALEKHDALARPEFGQRLERDSS